MSQFAGNIPAFYIGQRKSLQTLLVISCFAAAAPFAGAQQAKSFGTSASADPANTMAARRMGYVRPDFHKRVHNYFVGTFGPLQMTTLAFGSAISHADNVPPEWGQGWGAYGQRFASDIGSSTVNGTTNFLLGEALREDTKYYPCECRGIWPRVRHALISSVTARAGEDGHAVFSIPAVASPYAGAFSTLAWYPARYGPEDAFRTGNYDFLDSVGMKIALEFLHPLFRKLHRQ